MFNLTRVIHTQLIKSFIRSYPRKNHLFGLSLTEARYSSFALTGSEIGGEGRPKIPKRNRVIMTLAVGGLGYVGYKIIADQQASCAENECNQNCDEESECLHKMDEEEERIIRANKDLERILKVVKTRAIEATDKTIAACCEAGDLAKLFMDRAYCAIEEENLESTRFEEVWCEVYDLAVKRCEKVKDAKQKGKCAWELLCKLREVVDDGKACKYTCCNPLLITAEEALLCAELEILNAKAKMDCVQNESRIVEQYRNLVEDFRQDLKAEMESMLTLKPECRLFLTYNECNMVLTHAYKKILRVQKELSIIQEPDKDSEEEKQPESAEPPPSPPAEQTTSDSSEVCS